MTTQDAYDMRCTFDENITLERREEMKKEKEERQKKKKEDEEKAKTVIDVDEGESDTGLEKEIGNMALKDANGGAEKSN